MFVASSYAIEAKMKLSDYLKERGISKTAFAQTIGVSHVTVSLWALGKRVPSGASMVRLLEVTEGAVQPNDFFGGAN